MSEMNEKWSSLEETAEYLGVTKDTIRSWIKKTDIPAHKVGRLWKFKFSEVDEWVKSGKSAFARLTNGLSGAYACAKFKTKTDDTE